MCLVYSGVDEGVERWTVTDCSLWCCCGRIVSAHEACCLSIMYACEDTLLCLPTHLFALYMHVQMSWHHVSTIVLYVLRSIHVCYETEEAKRNDGSGLTLTYLTVRMLTKKCTNTLKDLYKAEIKSFKSWNQGAERDFSFNIFILFNIQDKHASPYGKMA